MSPFGPHAHRYAKDIEFGESEGRRMVRTTSAATKAARTQVASAQETLRKGRSADPEGFEALLRYIIELSAAPSRAGRAEELASVLRKQQAEARLKLQVVMMAGREGLSLGAAQASLAAAQPESSVELDGNSDALDGHYLAHGDLLARGYAIACATRVELEGTLDRWRAPESGELEERVWLRFGRQLASSPLEEWECLGALGTSGERLSQLYLRRGKEAWWSFGAVLDRPSTATVHKDSRRARSGRRHAKLDTLRNVALRRCELDRRALQRALRAICARIAARAE